MKLTGLEIEVSLMSEAPESSLNMTKVVKFRNLQQKCEGEPDIQISKYGKAVHHVMCITILLF